MGGLPTRTTPLSFTENHEPESVSRWQIERVSDVDPVEIGLALQQAYADVLTGPASTPTLLIWRSQRALLVSRSETRLFHFEAARAELKVAGWPVLPRKSGGGACPVAPGTVQISIIEPALPAATMNAKYAALATLIQAALATYGIVTRPGLVAGAYCPGSYDLAVDGRKIAGMSQHWFRNRCGVHCVITAASINVAEPPDTLARVVNQFYGSAGSPVRCEETALTNMRLCAHTGSVAELDLTAELMLRLGSGANSLGATVRQQI
jgi:lipoate-protein ligase A